MATEQIKINERQSEALAGIVMGVKLNLTDVDTRSAKALAARGLVKITENKKGKFVTPTAKGKKFLN